MKLHWPFDKRKLAEARWVKTHPIHWAELGARVEISAQSCGVRIQLFRRELIAYVKYGLYNHEIPGTDSHKYWEAIRAGAQSPQEHRDVASTLE